MIETRRLLLRPYGAADYSRLYEILTDPATMIFWPRSFTPDEVQAWIVKSGNDHKLYGIGRMAVFSKEKQIQIGDAGLVAIKISPQLCFDLGIIIQKAYQQKGYGTEAALALLDHAQAKFPKCNIEANMPCNHEASIRLAEKLGMDKCDEFRNPRNCGTPTYRYRVVSSDAI